MKRLLSILSIICCLVFTTLIRSIAQNSITSDIALPNGFARTQASNDFGTYLRRLPLKPKGSQVKYFNGSIKKNNNVYSYVIDLPIGNKDLHQCADAVMRLRADYFYYSKAYSKIKFHLTNGHLVDFKKWSEGYRIKVSGNKTNWVKTAKPNGDQKSYWSYLELIFNYAGTASLEQEMNSIQHHELEIGDVYIKGGFPGHATIVVDKAKNKSGSTIYLLAQSYMPAQELQILQNPNDRSLSPWYELTTSKKIITPEWTFTSSQLKRF
jgi:hypothetical protein